jgi:hypothetical protein
MSSIHSLVHHSARWPRRVAPRYVVLCCKRLAAGRWEVFDVHVASCCCDNSLLSLLRVTQLIHTLVHMQLSVSNTKHLCACRTRCASTWTKPPTRPLVKLCAAQQRAPTWRIQMALCPRFAAQRSGGTKITIDAALLALHTIQQQRHALNHSQPIVLRPKHCARCWAALVYVAILAHALVVQLDAANCLRKVRGVFSTWSLRPSPPHALLALAHRDRAAGGPYMACMTAMCMTLISVAQV